jgi:hypothetical protein
MAIPLDTAISGLSNCPSESTEELWVEFYGIPRLRAGVSEVRLPRVPVLGDLVLALCQRFPDFARECAQGNQLSATCTANLDGKRFVRDPQTPLAGVSTVLILSTDSGG